MAGPSIRVEAFCSLSTNDVWQAWLHKYDVVLYQELVEHLKVSRGCGHNREKMVELMGKIEAMPGGHQALVDFLKVSFPSMLDWSGADPVPQPVPQQLPGVELPQVPFVWTGSGSQLTFPRRAVLEHQDHNVLLENVRQLVSDKVKYDYVILGSRAYVEFVPATHAKIVDQIPDKNWKVTVYKRMWSMV